MNRDSALCTGLVTGMVALALVVFLIIPSPSFALTTTSTVIGWLVPDGPHWNNGIAAFLFPIVGVGMMAGLGKVVDAGKEFGVTLILAGLVVGGLMGMLSLTSSSNNVIPFALVIVPAFDLLFWMWKGGG